MERQARGIELVCGPWGLSLFGAPWAKFARVAVRENTRVESMCSLGPIFSSIQKSQVSISRGVRVLDFESSSLPRGGGCAQEEKRLGWVRPQN